MLGLAIFYNGTRKILLQFVFWSILTGEYDWIGASSITTLVISHLTFYNPQQCQLPDQLRSFTGEPAKDNWVLIKLERCKVKVRERHEYEKEKERERGRERERKKRCCLSTMPAKLFQSYFALRSAFSNSSKHANLSFILHGKQSKYRSRGN